MNTVKDHHFRIRYIHHTGYFCAFALIFFCSKSCSIERTSNLERKGLIPEAQTNKSPSYGDLQDVSLEHIKISKFVELLSDKGLLDDYNKPIFIEKLKDSGYKLDSFEMSVVAPILFKILLLESDNKLALRAANNLENLADGEWAFVYDHYRALWEQSSQ